MTPKRVSEIAASVGEPITNLTIERAITLAVNEALEEAAKVASERYAREYASADSAFMEGRYDAAGEIADAIRALKLKEE